MEQADSRKIILSVLGIALLLVAVVGISYSIFVFTSNSKTENVITTGAISMSYSEGITNVMSIKNALPTIDEVGKKQKEYFDFEISANITGRTKINYQIIAKNTTLEEEKNTPIIPLENQLDSSQVKFYLEKQEGSQYVEVLKPTIFSDLGSTLTQTNNERILYTGSFINVDSDKFSKTEKFILRMWLNSEANIDDIARTFKVKIDVKATTE